MTTLAPSRRCPWAADDLLRDYHDTEWGVPVHDDRHLFELVVLEGAQAGLSWSTILRKRDAYRRAFRGFDVERVARFGEDEVARLLGDAGIVRHEAKIRSAIANARAALEVIEELGGLDTLFWKFVDGRPRQNRWRSAAEVPSLTVESDALSTELRRRGFTFVGSTTCYALMQAAGLVNDHIVPCFRHGEVARLS
ncbi:MAG: DNA-3-methyladenine glycosylase I [Thermoanaerobaculia bacterium]|nr:MAG: DNA-3-methyladenine glycosylase I [Thermoanaerobaculia bacterium]